MEELTIELQDYSSLKKEELVTLLENRDKTEKTYLEVLGNKDKRFQDMLSDYKKDYDYLQELNSNVVQYYKTKEKAMSTILESLVILNTLDNKPLYPTREEEQDDTVR